MLLLIIITNIVNIFEAFNDIISKIYNLTSLRRMEFDTPTAKGESIWYKEDFQNKGK